MKILFLTTILLTKNRNGGEVASQCFIDGLRQLGHQVVAIGYLRHGDVLEPNPQDTIVVDERYTETTKAKFYPILWLIFGFWKGLPYSAAKYYSNNYIKTVRSACSNGSIGHAAIMRSHLASTDYDAVIIEHSQLGWLVNYIENTNNIIFSTQNIEHEIYLEHLKNTRNFLGKLIYQREARLIKQMEDKIARVAKDVWTLTPHDANYFSKLTKKGNARVFDLPANIENIQEKPTNKICDIGLLASWTWKANQEALEWFLQAIYPHLPNNLSIQIAGKGADWLTDKYSNINYRGVVPDAQEFMAQAKVVAIPTLSGGGIQIKTLDAIASGSSIVATPVALRGISYPPPTVKVAQEAENFAKLLVSAITEPPTQEVSHEAYNWYRLRRDKFLNDIAHALKEL